MKITKNEYAMLYFNFFKQDYYLEIKKYNIKFERVNR